MFIKYINLLDVKIDTKSLEEKNTFSGYASVFNKIDSYNDTILPGAYKNVLESDFQPYMYFNHRHNDVPIGIWAKMSEDEYGLKVEGQLLSGHSMASDVKAAIKANIVTGLSIGYSLKQTDYEMKNGIRFIKNISHLEEVSIVTKPADSFARIDTETVKSFLGDEPELKHIESLLREEGQFSNNASKLIISSIKAQLRDAILNEEIIESNDEIKTDEVDPELLKSISNFSNIIKGK